MKQAYKHLKTGNIYYLVKANVISATNGDTNEGKLHALYEDKFGNQFIRELKEFSQKFKLISCRDCARFSGWCNDCRDCEDFAKHQKFESVEDIA
jgi:hypothetical protein